jgi:hypothetical protein
MTPRTIEPAKQAAAKAAGFAYLITLATVVYVRASASEENVPHRAQHRRIQLAARLVSAKTKRQIEIRQKILHHIPHTLLAGNRQSP